MIIGITGNSGTGKTSICKALEENKINGKTPFVIDADRVVKKMSAIGEEYATKNITEDNTSCKFSISSTGSKTAKIQIKSTEGTVLTTKTFTYNSGEDKSI